MKTLPVLLIFSCLLTVSCGGSSFTSRDAGFATDSESAPSAPEYAKNADAPGGGDGGGGRDPQYERAAQNISLDQQSQAAPTVRKIIKNAELTLEAGDPEAVQKKISAIAEEKGGFIVETQQSSIDRRSGGRDTVTMTLRVPADKFADAVEEIRKTADRVIVETVKGQDVTEEFIDIEARLKAHRALEEQFLEIMTRANSVADALNVQRQLAEVRGEIEKIEGRKRFLENQASLSTIKARIQTPAAMSASGSGFFYRLTEAVGTGFDAALGFVLGLVTVVIALIPFLLFICLPAYLLLRYLWKRIKRRRTAAEIARDELAAEAD